MYGDEKGIYSETSRVVEYGAVVDGDTNSFPQRIGASLCPVVATQPRQRLSKLLKLYSSLCLFGHLEPEDTVLRGTN